MSDQASPHTHENRDMVLKRLARIEGHVRGIKRMLEDDAECSDVLVQIAAVRAALNNVGLIILEDLRSCMVRAAMMESLTMLCAI
jgi:CsoR family transcriptional regulator, copper-sensing transcriptional repressor